MLAYLHHYPELVICQRHLLQEGSVEVHDIGVVSGMTENMMIMYAGHVVESGRTRDLIDRPKHPYTQMLLAAAPKLDAFGEVADVPEGEIPDPIAPPPGCVFHPRCPLAQDVCRAERPAWRNVRGGKVACHLAE